MEVFGTFSKEGIVWDPFEISGQNRVLILI
jgi:hypothetical protein